METNIPRELEDLKEIALAKIKLAYNHSIDFESTHSVLWDHTEKKMHLFLKLTLILSFILLIILYVPILFGFINLILIAVIISGFIVLAIVGLIFYILFEMNYLRNHKKILEEAISLRREADDFLQYKLENLDKQAYIDEILSLETHDNLLKEKSQIYALKLSTENQNQIVYKLNSLEKLGYKKQEFTKEFIETVNNKLKLFPALKNSEHLIKIE